MKNLAKNFFILVALTGFSCSEDIPDCPSKMCVVAGTWRLTEVYVDDEREDTDLSKFSLILDSPVPATAITADFSRIQASGNSDAGLWSIENNGTILRLIPANDSQMAEDWIIESFSPRQLILVINRDISFKAGPAKIRFVLEPI